MRLYQKIEETWLINYPKKNIDYNQIAMIMIRIDFSFDFKLAIQTKKIVTKPGSWGFSPV